VLSKGTDDGLMVSGGVNREETVSSRGETGGDISSKLAVCGGSVQTLEELEDGGVSGVGIEDTVNSLDDDVRVTNDLTLAVQLLGSSEVVDVGVDKVTSLEVADRHGDREVGVFSDVLQVGRGDELARRLGTLCGDITHGDGVTRASDNLQTIADGLSNAEVDEVVRRGQRSDLTSFTTIDVKTVLGQVGTDR